MEPRHEHARDKLAYVIQLIVFSVVVLIKEAFSGIFSLVQDSEVARALQRVLISLQL